MRNPNAPSQRLYVTQSTTTIHGVSHIDFEDTEYMCHGFSRTLRIWRRDHNGVLHSMEFNLFGRDADDIRVYGDARENARNDLPMDVPLDDNNVLDDCHLTDRDDSDIHDDINDIIDRT